VGDRRWRWRRRPKECTKPLAKQRSPKEPEGFGLQLKEKEKIIKRERWPQTTSGSPLAEIFDKV